MRCRPAARTRCRSGSPKRIPWLKRQTRLTFARCGIIDPRSLDDYRAHGGYKGLRARADADLAEIVEDVTESGLRGRGGAGFPTGIKWKTVLDTSADQKYIVCNADEGDSGTFADRMIMEGDPFVLIEGMAIAGIAVGATKGYIYIRSEYPHAVATMNAGDRGRAGGRLLGDDVARLGQPSTWKCGSAPAPMSAARRPRCSKAWKASAASCAPSRRCRRTRACSASRPSSTM